MEKRLKEIKDRLDNTKSEELEFYIEESGLYGNVTYNDGLSLFDVGLGGDVHTYKEDAIFIAKSKEDIQYLLNLVGELEEKLKQV